MLTTTIPDVIDFYLAAWRDLPECQAPVVVFDGMPDSAPDTLVTIGGTSTPVTVGNRTWASLGGPSGIPAQDETYAINCVVSSYVGGGSEAQKTARDNAFTIFEAIEVQVRKDPQCGGLLGTGWTTFSEIEDMTQTSADDPEVDKGRICTVLFTISVFSRRRSE